MTGYPVNGHEYEHEHEHDYEVQIAHLSQDPVMAAIIGSVELPPERASRGLFGDLVAAIVSQQLSVIAADAILSRVVALFPHHAILARPLRDLSEEDLRGAGLSRPKVRYLYGIADAVINKTIDLDALSAMPDEEVIAALTQLNGVGRWTAEMLLIFSLRRPDVFPVGDLGVRNAIARAYGIDRDDYEAARRISRPWAPYRTLACRYLWATLKNEPV